MQIKLYGIKYDGRNLSSQELIKNPLFAKSLFIFNDNYSEHFTCKQGAGNAFLRQFNKFSSLEIPKSVGIPTGYHRKGYMSLDEGKTQIDECLVELITLISTGNYDSIVYSINQPDDPLLGTGIFEVSNDVLKYITMMILEVCKDGELYCCSNTKGQFGPMLIDENIISRYR